MSLGVKVPVISEFNDRGIKQAQNSFKNLTGTTGKLQTKLNSVFGAAGMAGGPYGAGIASIAAAATALGTALFNMAKAAGEDAKSQAILATALKNMTGATDEQIAKVEEYITVLQMASGIADTEFRTGMQNLVRATNDVTKSQELLKVAMDVSVGTGKDLDSVTIAIGKAYKGNVGALKKLGLPLSDAVVKSNDFAGAMRELLAVFGGTAAANADTLSGKMDILNQKWEEAKEKIGQKLLPFVIALVDIFMKLLDIVDDIVGGFEFLIQKLKPLGDAFDFVANKVKGVWGRVKRFIPWANNAASATANMGNAASATATSIQDLMMILNAETVPMWRMTTGMADLNDHLKALGYDVDVVAKKTNNFGGSIQDPITDLQRFTEAVIEAQKNLADLVTGYLDLNKAAETGSIRGFVGSVSGQAAQIKNLAKNLGTLSGRGLSPQALQGIMSLDLGTAASLAQDLVNSAFSTRYIRQLNTAYQGINATATQFGQQFGANFMTGGAVPVSIGQVTVVSNDPRKFVSGLRQYARANGSVPIPVTGSL